MSLAGTEAPPYVLKGEVVERETVTATLPVFVNVSGSVVVAPTLRFPNASGLGEIVRMPPAAVCESGMT